MGVTITRNGKVVNAIEAGPRAITNTDISNFAFTPTITINAGDTVTWTNKDGAPHTATSDATPAVFDSGTLNLNDSYSFTFLTAGSFPYHCAIHPFMTGTVVVNGAPQPPAISSALAVTAVANQPFNYTLTATGTPAPTLSFTNVPNGFQVNGATITGTFSAAGQVSIGVHASNASGTDDKTLVVTVNQAPAISSTLTASATVGSPFTYTLTATGTPAPTLSFTNVPSGFQVNGAAISGTFSAPGQVSIDLHASNSAGNDDKTLIVTVNQAPAITSPLTANATIGVPFSYTLTATGSPAPTLSFTNVPNGFQVNGATINGTFNATGPVSIDLHASNSVSTVDKTLVVSVAGVSPAITSSLTASAIVGVPFNYTLMATGNPAPALSFTNIPNGFQVNGAQLSGTFAAQGQVSIDVHASNTQGTDDKTLVVTVAPATAPAITSALTANATVGVGFNYTLTATGNPPPSLSFTSVPNGFTVNGATLSGIFSSAGQVSIGIHASNVGGTDNQALVVTVTPPLAAPVITSALTAGSKVGVPFSYTLTAIGQPPPSLSFTALPSGITANGAALSGTFTASGTFSIGLHASNSQGSDDKTLFVTVDPADAAPVITSALTATAVVGQSFTYTLTATGSPAPALSFTTVPAGIAVNGDKLTGAFTSPGQFMIGVHAISSSGSDDKTLLVSVGPAPIPAKITSPLTATAIVGLDFSYIITATGDAPITFGATLPSGLTLNGATIAGTFSAPGTVTIPLTASNSAGSDPQILVVTVMPNTEGISGNWGGKLKGKLFDETGSAKPSVGESGTIDVTFFQTGRDLAVRVTLNRPSGSKSYVLNGRIGLNNLWAAGVDIGLLDNLTLSAQLNKNGKTVKGIGILVNAKGAEEFSYTISRK
jgi:plastocyanin